MKAAGIVVSMVVPVNSKKKKRKKKNNIYSYRRINTEGKTWMKKQERKKGEKEKKYERTGG